MKVPPSFPMEQVIASLPKAELHVHLEGCIGPESLRKLAEQHRTPLAGQGNDVLGQLYCTGDFTGFLHAFKTICQHLRTPEDYESVTYDTLRDLARQNVRYAEITLSAGVILWKGEDLAGSFAGVQAGSSRARADFGIRAQWIFDAVRQFGPEAAMAVVRVADSLRDSGVIGFGIGGDERQAPPEWFKEVFAVARGCGLRLTAHAGETSGPESVWNAVNVLGAHRIGHALSAHRDERLVEELVKRQLPVDVCLTSNLKTGCLTNLRDHPLRSYFDRGMLVSLNTDDPALFGTNLNREYLLAHEVFGFSREELTRLAQSSFQAAFLTPEEKQPYLDLFAEPRVADART